MPASPVAGTTTGIRDTYVYVVSGTLTIDYGPGGRDQVHAGPVT